MTRLTAGLPAALLATLLAGCGSTPVKAPEQQATPTDSSALDTASLLSSLANPQPLPELPLTTRSFLLSSEQPDIGASGYSFVLLPHIALDGNESSRQVKTCNALRTALESAEQDSEAGELLLPVYWPLFRDTDLSDCPALVENHDHQRARELLGKLSSELQEGPLLAAWPADGKQMLVLDLSSFSNEDIDQVLALWTGPLARDPQFWNDGINVKQIRAQLRSVLQNYEQANLRVVSTEAD